MTGRILLAVAVLGEIVEKNASTWAAFGYVAAESDLARLRKRGG